MLMMAITVAKIPFSCHKPGIIILQYLMQHLRLHYSPSSRSTEAAMTGRGEKTAQAAYSRTRNITMSDKKISIEPSSTIEAEALDERILFERARNLIQPKRLFRFVTLLYAERKLIVFFLAHFIATMVVWSHFAILKFEKQTSIVPEGAPRYWWKILAPSAEFGTMHAILFQMALLPLTMSRYTIAQLATSTGLSKFIPLNRMLAIHKHLGYVMVGCVFLATVFFFAFFGLLCSDGDQNFCDKFTSEIMITGESQCITLRSLGGGSGFEPCVFS